MFPTREISETWADPMPWQIVCRLQGGLNQEIFGHFVFADVRLADVLGYGEPNALAELGFVVMMLDGMGTPGRSREFQDCWQIPHKVTRSAMINDVPVCTPVASFLKINFLAMADLSQVVYASHNLIKALPL